MDSGQIRATMKRWDQQGDTMSNEILSGTIAPATPKRTKRGYSLFDPLIIGVDGGGQRVIKKASAAGGVADALRRGGKGRFYLSTYGGQTGVHGVRLDDGTQAYAHYNNVEKMLLIGVFAGLFMLIMGLIGYEGFMITPVLIGAALAVFYFYLRSNRLAAKAHYDAAL